MDCPVLPDSGYLPFRNRLYRSALDRRVPIAGTMDITSRCNLGCVHCYIPHGDPGPAGMSRDTVRGIVDQLADQGCLWLLLTGGEPLSRPDFPDIYRHVKARGILPMIFTNGTLITDGMADLLGQMPPYLVEISIYGATEETSQLVTGVPGSLGMALRGLERLHERKVRVSLKTMVMTLNVHELDAMASIAESYGVHFRFDTQINSGLDGSSGPLKYRLSPEETVKLDSSREERLEECRELVAGFSNADEEDGSIYQCGAGMNTFHIDPHGMLSVCMMSRERTYSLLDGTFEEGWRSFIPQVLSRKWSRAVPCRNCVLKSLCGQCPGWGYLEHGDPEARVDHLCRTAFLRAEILGLGDICSYDRIVRGVCGTNEEQ